MKRVLGFLGSVALTFACPRRGLRRVVGPGLLMLIASACPRRGLRRVVGPGLLMLIASACGGTTIDPLLDGGNGDGNSGKDSSEPFACGTSTCDGDQICIHPCCGGAPPPCEPLDDGGTCPAGYVISNQCYNFGTGGTTGCVPPPCKPPPPYCAPSGSSNMCGFEQGSRDCYEACG